VFSRFRSFIFFVGIATLIASLVRLCLLEDFRIASGSMVPSLLSGDLVFVNKFEYNLRLPFANYELAKFRRPKVTDVVAFTLPDRGLETFVKRVVAVEGDKVALRGGIFYVNDRAAAYQPADLPTPAGMAPEVKVEWEQMEGVSRFLVVRDLPHLKDYGPVDVPPGYFFVMGDNRADSVDSRTWGPIPYSCLKGRVGLIWLSVNPLGDIRRDRVGKWVQ
jgi:signal peptidase I